MIASVGELKTAIKFQIIHSAPLAPERNRARPEGCPAIRAVALGVGVWSDWREHRRDSSMPLPRKPAGPLQNCVRHKVGCWLGAGHLATFLAQNPRERAKSIFTLAAVPFAMAGYGLFAMVAGDGS